MAKGSTATAESPYALFVDFWLLLQVLRPGLRKGPWTQEEDTMIVRDDKVFLAKLRLD